MIATTIERLLNVRPFVPFSVHTTGGNCYLVATSDHANFNPLHSVIVIWFDDGGGLTIPIQHIATVESKSVEA